MTTTQANAPSADAAERLQAISTSAAADQRGMRPADQASLDVEAHSSATAKTLSPSQRVLHSLRRIIRAVEVHSRKLKTVYGITGPQLVCLLTIVESERISTSALARKVHLSASTIVGILDRLVERGLVERQRDVRDRRLVYVSATEKGRDLAVDAPSPLQDTLAGALRQLSDGEQVAISLSLERVVELMEAGHIQAEPDHES